MSGITRGVSGNNCEGLRLMDEFSRNLPELTISGFPYSGGPYGKGGTDPLLDPFGYDGRILGPSGSSESPLMKKPSSIPCDGLPLLSTAELSSSSSISGPENELQSLNLFQSIYSIISNLFSFQTIIQSSSFFVIFNWIFMFINRRNRQQLVILLFFAFTSFRWLLSGNWIFWNEWTCISRG